MKILVISDIESEFSSNVQSSLSSAGNVAISNHDPDISQDKIDVAVTVVPPDARIEQSENLRQQVEVVRQADVVVVGATLSQSSALPAEITSLPVEGPWVEICEGGRNITPLLARLDTLMAARTQTEEQVTEKLPIRVFISHSSDDKLASDVRVELERHGMDVFWSEQSIGVGEDWLATITTSINESDVFVLLLSPNVIQKPDWVYQELLLAKEAKRRIIPVILKPIPGIPQNFAFLIRNLHFINLDPGFEVGIGRIVEAISGQAGAPSKIDGFRAKVHRTSEKARRVAHEHELGKKAKKYGSAALAGAAATAVAAGKILSEQQEEQRVASRIEERRKEHARKVSMKTYLDRTFTLLQEAVEETQRAFEMSPSDYREEFRPKFWYVLGKLESEPVPERVRHEHEALVTELRKLLDEFDDLVRKIEMGNRSAAHRFHDRLNRKWGATLQSSLDWISSVSASLEE
ncbi:toll/interleukin-1 receptor domain-containing protein [Frankia sp. R43]|uniref:toll/interleukin-1 receptor domain-containing protein n=1 Tax=Frankia sp. R43 TaxID=269536 RepID=UPI0009F9CE7D|nr:toll/interleukin-1 receptor domain-containing protein [Frankia sp. R43]